MRLFIGIMTTKEEKQATEISSFKLRIMTTITRKRGTG